MSTPWIWNPMQPSDPPPASGGSSGPSTPSPIPVHPLLWHPVRTRIDVERAPHGRVIGVEYSYDYQPSHEAFQKALGPHDVVWAPLFNGTISDPAQDSSRRLQEYDDNVRAIAQIAPNVKAVVLGNANAEIRFSGCTPAEQHEKCLTFIEQNAAFMAHHGRAAFAPVFDILVYDCYKGRHELRDRAIASNALILSFAGCSWLFEEPGDHPKIPEPRPYSVLANYLSTLEAWSGVGTLNGIEKGSGDVLKSMGFSAGFAGWY